MYTALLWIVFVFIAGAQCTRDILNRFETYHNTLNQERFHYFDTELLKEIARKEKGNVVISSASVKTVLALLLEAAEGTSYNELRELLGLPENETAAQEELHKFQRILLGPHSANQSVTLKAASRIFVSPHYIINPDYQRQIEKQYHSGVTYINFMNPEITASNINYWVKMFTNGLIPVLLDPSMVQPDTHMVLTNAIYFKGNWLQEFLPSATKIQCFYSDSNTCISSYMMTQVGEHKYGYVSSLHSEVLQLLYEDRRHSMVIILPNKKNGIAELTRNISHQNVQNILPKLEKTEVFVTIPRFTVEFSIQLVPILQALGTHEIFTNAANLPKLSSNTRSKVDVIVHKAKIEVNEQGTKAGAATGVALVPLMSTYTPKFNANHPFFFFIYDEQAQEVLFSGRLNTPDEVSQAESSKLPVQPYLPSVPSQPTNSRRPSQTISSFAESRPYPSTGYGNGQRYEPKSKSVRYQSSKNNDKIYFYEE